MAVNWSLLQPVDIGGAFQNGFQTGQQMVEKERMQNALAAYVQNPNDLRAQSVLARGSSDFALRLVGQRQKDAAEMAEKERMRAILSNPDPRQAAMAAGELDIAAKLDSLGENDRLRATGKLKVAGSIAYQMRQMRDPAQRAALFQQARPLLEGAGYSPQELDGFDVTNDTALDSFIAAGQTVDQLISQGKIHWQQVGERPSFATDAMGRPIGSANPYAGAVTSPPAPVASSPASPPGGGGGLFEYDGAGGRVTSSYRTPQRNREVGGVANSYHTRRDSAGNPMAADLVPPPGMSMGAFHAELKRRNPGIDVINEGDHVHLEPRGGAPRAAAAAAPGRIQSKADYDRLPKGTAYIAPDGSRRVKS